MISVPLYAKRISSAKQISYPQGIAPVPTGTDIIEKQRFYRFFQTLHCLENPFLLNAMAFEPSPQLFSDSYTAIHINYLLSFSK